MNRKRLIITSVISIVLISVLMISTTYSIFTSSEIDESANVYTTGNLDVTYTLSEDNIKLENSDIMSNETSIKIKPYRITVTNNGTVPYMFDLMLSDTTASDVINYEYLMVQVGKLEPITLADCTYNTIKEDIIVPANGSATIDVRIWVSDKIKNTEIGKSFYAKLSVNGLAIYNDSADIDNSVLIAETKPKISEYIENLYNDGSSLTTLNIGNDISQPTISLNEIQKIMLDNNEEYRYYSNNPNNYLNFNGELWRIISSSIIKNNEDDETGEQRVKIIRDSSIGNYSWDSSDAKINSGTGINDWTESDLMTELNTLYYNKKEGNCYNGEANTTTKCDFTKIGFNTTSKNLIDNALWYVDSIERYENLYANDYYNLERSINTWTGKVGLIYPSDYVYATDLNLCTTNDYTSDNCTSNNWLYKNNSETKNSIWTLSPWTTADSISAFGISTTGKIEPLEKLSNSYNVYPVVYLKSDVIILDGKGTIDEPYTIQ